MSARVLTEIDECRAALRAEVARARRIVPFTGAGISTESGIPDFRSPDSRWRRHKPIPYDAFLASEAVRAEAWRRKFAMDDSYAGAKPSIGHRAVAALIRAGQAAVVVTQNIDGLHQAAGVPASQVIELHGNSTFAKCVACEMRHELADVRGPFEASGAPPVCVSCGAPVKSATISFGQAMPRAELARAAAEMLACDLVLAIGSSLVVYPAAALPVRAKETGARLVIINREPGGLDDEADLILRGEIGPIMSALPTGATA